jgi:membrane dipeptidase
MTPSNTSQETSSLMNRRNLLSAMTAGVAASTLSFGYGRSAAAAATKRARANSSELFVVNSLGGLDDGYTSPRPSGRQVISPEAIDAALRSGLAATNLTLDSNDFENAVASIAKHDDFIRNHADKLTKIWTAQQIRDARADGKVGLIYGVQNTTMLGATADRVDVFADLGLRVVQLTYNPPNNVGGGSTAPGNPGLTDFGRAVIERLNNRRLVVDLSHSGQQLCLDAGRASRQPIAITHTGCRALTNHPRNKTDEELRLVADKGGYVGIFFIMYLAAGRPHDSRDVAAHIEHAIDVCGEDHVGIGSDYGVEELVGNLESRQSIWGDMVKKRKQDGSNAPGEEPELLPYAEDLTGPSQFRVLADALDKRGHSSARIEKIMGGNFLRYLRDTWGA